jgi:transposase
MYNAKIIFMKTKTNDLYLCAGIDISKDTMDVHYNNSSGEHHLKVPNDISGFKQLSKVIGKQHHYVMETTGPYYLKLAFYLKQTGCKVSVENSLTIKRFIQMNNERNKNDKKDARWIFRYGILQNPKEWQMPSDVYMESIQLQNAIELLTKQSTMLSNLLHSMQHMPLQDKLTRKVLRKQLSTIDKELEVLQKGLAAKIQAWVPDQLENLLSVPGLGKRTAAHLIIFTDGFTKVNNYRQLISLAGLSPKEFSCGISVKKRVRICKMGGSSLRNLLYMCSMSAIKKNKACKDLYERIKAKGKNGKLALIAVCNKLLKQAFAIAKNGTKYNENYMRPKPC